MMRTVIRWSIAATLAAAAASAAWARDEEPEHERIAPIAAKAGSERATAMPAPSSSVDYLTFDAEPAVARAGGGSIAVVPASAHVAAAASRTEPSPGEASWHREREGYRDGGH